MDYDTARARIGSAASLLPDSLPPVPSVHPAGPEHLTVAANTLGGVLLIVGFGDGSIIDHIGSDPVLRQKTVHVLALRGEEGAVAHWICDDRHQSILAGYRVSLYLCPDDGRVRSYCLSNWASHDQIARLGGLDMACDHPAGCSEAVRASAVRCCETILGDLSERYGNDIADTFTGLYHASMNARRLLQAPSIADCRGILGDRPVICIAAGPSLERHLDDILAAQNGAYIIACDAACKALIDAGVRVDATTPLERTQPVIGHYADADCGGITYAGLPVVQPTAVDNFNQYIYMHCADRLYAWLDPNEPRRITCGSSTGTLAVALACEMSNGPVYLIGHDLSFDGDRSHWSGSEYAEQAQKNKLEQHKKEHRVDMVDDHTMAECYDGGQVTSQGYWDRFRREIESMLAVDAKKRQGARRFVNVGATSGRVSRIIGAEPGPLPPLTQIDLSIVWPERNPDVYKSWCAKAKMLAEDSAKMVEAMRDIVQSLDAIRKNPPHSWDVESMASAVCLRSYVSDQNQEAFAYLFRSCLYNGLAEMHSARLRARSEARANWASMDVIEQTACGISQALTKLQGPIEKIVETASDD